MIRIKFNRRLLATAFVGIALVISAALVVSLRGDDKPVITTNPPAADEEPQDAQVNPTPEEDVQPPSDDSDATDDEDQSDYQDTPDEPETPDDDEDGPGDDEEDEPEDEGKAHGIQNAIDAHLKNIERMEMKNKTTPPGLQHSLELLEDKYADMMSGEHNNGQGKGKNKNA